jgi:hypothetical protein
MRRSSRRLIILAIGLAAFVLGSALLYQAGMARLEGKPRTFWESIEWSVETVSTTGYGYDSHWTHPAMVILVVAVQFVGVLLFFLIVPIFMIPFLEERFEEKLPRTAGNIAHHIVIYRFGPAVETLLQRLKHDGVPSLVIETDEAAARTVLEQKLRVVFTRTEDALDMPAPQVRAGRQRPRRRHARSSCARGRWIPARSSRSSGPRRRPIDWPARLPRRATSSRPRWRTQSHHPASGIGCIAGTRAARSARVQ